MADPGREDRRLPEGPAGDATRAGSAEVAATVSVVARLGAAAARTYRVVSVAVGLIVAVASVGAMTAVVGVVGAGPAAAVGVCPDVYRAPDVVPAEVQASAIEPGAARPDIDEALDDLRDADVDVHVVPEPPQGVEAWVERFFFAVDPERPGDPIESIPPGLEAWVCLGGKVPQVHGTTVGDATELLRAAGLAIGTAAAPSWRVAEIDQAVGAVLPFGSVVNVVTVWPGVAPAPATGTVETPGAAISGPREETAPGTAAGAVPEETGSTTDDVARATGDGVAAPPWLLAVLLVLLAGLAGPGLVRHRRRRPPRIPQVDVRLRDDVPSTRVTELPGVHRAHTVEVRTHVDEPHITVESPPPEHLDERG